MSKEVCNGLGCNRDATSSGYCSDDCLMDTMNNLPTRTLAHAKHKSYMVPDVNVLGCGKLVKEHMTLVPLRGHAHTLMVISSGGNEPEKAIGYLAVSDLGYDNVKEWMVAEKWVDVGF